MRPRPGAGGHRGRPHRRRAGARWNGITVVGEWLKAMQRAVCLEHAPDPVGSAALDRIRRHARIVDDEPERDRERRALRDHRGSRWHRRLRRSVRRRVGDELGRAGSNRNLLHERVAGCCDRQRQQTAEDESPVRRGDCLGCNGNRSRALRQRSHGHRSSFLPLGSLLDRLHWCAGLSPLGEPPRSCPYCRRREYAPGGASDAPGPVSRGACRRKLRSV